MIIGNIALIIAANINMPKTIETKTTQLGIILFAFLPSSLELGIISGSISIVKN